MQIVLQVRPEVVRTLNQQAPATSDSEALLQLIETSGLQLVPMHRDVADPDLQRYFTIDVVGDETARRIVDRLNQSVGVTAAYIKPPDELP